MFGVVKSLELEFGALGGFIVGSVNYCYIVS